MVYRVFVDDPRIKERARPGDNIGVLFGEMVDQKPSPFMASFFRLLTVDAVANSHGILERLLA